MSCLQFMTTHELIMELNLDSNTDPVLPTYSAISPLTSHNTTPYCSSDPQRKFLFLPHHIYSALLSLVLIVAQISAQAFLKPPIHSVSELDTKTLKIPPPWISSSFQSFTLVSYFMTDLNLFSAFHNNAAPQWTLPASDHNVPYHFFKRN